MPSEKFWGNTPLYELSSWFLKFEKRVGKAQGHVVSLVAVGRGSQKNSEAARALSPSYT